MFSTVSLTGYTNAAFTYMVRCVQKLCTAGHPHCMYVGQLFSLSGLAYTFFQNTHARPIEAAKGGAKRRKRKPNINQKFFFFICFENCSICCSVD